METVTITREQFRAVMVEEAARAVEESKADGLPEDKCEALMTLLITHSELLGRRLFGPRG